MEKEYLLQDIRKNRIDKQTEELHLQAKKTGIEGYLYMTSEELIAAIKLFSV